MDEHKWRTVSLPRILIDRLENEIEQKKLPYNNIRSFIEDSIRERCRCLGININSHIEAKEDDTNAIPNEIHN